MTTKQELLAEYNALEDAIENTAMAEMWRLADWLADHVPHAKPGPKSSPRGGDLTIADLVAEGRRGQAQLHRLRVTAVSTRPDRIPGVSTRAYAEALRLTKQNLAAANARLRERGVTLRDQHAGPMESVNALRAGLARRTPQERARFAADILKDDDVAEAAVNLPAPTRESISRVERTANARAQERMDEAREKRRGETADSEHWSYNRVSYELAKGLARLRDALQVARDARFRDNPELVEFIGHDIDKCRQALDLIDIAVRGESEVDWDAELAKLTDDA